MKRFLCRAAILLCIVAVFTASGCMLLPIYSCVSISQCGISSTDSFNVELGNYSMCEFSDEERGIGFKIYYNYNGYDSYHWGHVTVDGEEVPALFQTYYDGETHVYVSVDEMLTAFNEEVAILMLAFDGDDIVCKQVIYDIFNYKLDGIRFKYKSLNSSDFLPHEGRLSDYISDENHILTLYRGFRTAYYLGKARTVKGGEIKTCNVKLVFLYDGVFEIYDSDEESLISQGTYKLIDDNTATLEFGQNDYLYAEKPFETYPRLTISGTYYNGIY